MAHCEQVDAAVGTMAPPLSRLRALLGALPARDGVAVFTRVYTEAAEAADRRAGEGVLPAVRAASALDARLAERALAALDAPDEGRRPPACWRPLLQFRRHPGVRPVQFALAGVHAQAGHDLALALVDTCRTLGCEPVDLETEFDRVGDLLASVEERAREELTPGPDRLRLADPLAHLLGAWSLERAREAAWSAARALWALRPQPEIAGELADRLDTTAGLAARMLLIPLPGPHTKARHA
ncbi:DUF5995 family protein [Streptomyces tagetis]|uniref:Uncharacterized protein n=1 Tax=Streptomyces tagetis TaxID=2820809 RepID=A0A940XR87_9ACTN|nr:DUF5995 family protein [Streptomyces sp. RG38]MBQ0829655.1 hypothetical protein [Streptomyces sp. RG38]